MFKKICLLLVLVLIAGVSFVGCGSSPDTTDEDTSWTDIQAKGKFVVGLDDAFPPMGFRGESGEIEGFDIDLAKAVASYLGVDVEFQPIDWNSKEMELERGDIDVVWNGLTMSQERIDSTTWGFSQPYLQNKQVIVTMSDSGIDTIADLAGKKVGVQLDSSAQSAVEGQPEVLATFDNGELFKFDTYPTAILDMKSGNIDAIVGDEILIMYIMAKDGDGESSTLVLASDDFGDEFYGVGFRKADVNFINQVNDALNALIEDGTAAQISEKWFGDDIVYVPAT